MPARPAARYAVSTWWTGGSLNLWPKAASDTCSAAEPLTSFSFMPLLLLGLRRLRLGRILRRRGLGRCGLGRCGLRGLLRRPARLGRRRDLARCVAGGLERRTHDHLATRRPGHRAADEEQVSFQVHLHHAQVLDRAALDAHVAGHAPPLEYSSRRLALADGARRAGRQAGAVGGVAAREVVTLHGAREALADGRPRDVDDLPLLEEVGLDLGPGRGLGLVGRRLRERDACVPGADAS